MSHPRMSIPAATYLVTRSTVMSLFLLAPSPAVNQIMEYCIAWAACGRGILIHAVSVESNHFHTVVTDPERRISGFMQELNRCAARCLLEHYRSRFPKRRLDAMWSPAQSFSATLLISPDAVLDKLVYTLTNPVKDGLVRDYRKWPGFNTRPGDWRDGARCVQRPKEYFKNTPETLEYQICAPPQLADSVEQAIATVQHHIHDRQHELAAQLAQQRRSVVGVRGVLATKPLDAPTTPRPLGNLNPALAGGGDAQALSKAKVALKTFRRAYREAWQAFKAGLSVVFPGGTLLMRTRFGQPCAPLDISWCVTAT